MSCGDTHTCVLTDEGEVFTFGRNQNGQLGLGTDSDCLSPTRVGTLQVLLPTSHCAAEAAASGSLDHSFVGYQGSGKCELLNQVQGAAACVMIGCEAFPAICADCLQGGQADPEMCCGGSIILMLLLWLGLCTAIPNLQHQVLGHAYTQLGNNAPESAAWGPMRLVTLLQIRVRP